MSNRWLVGEVGTALWMAWIFWLSGAGAVFVSAAPAPSGLYPGSEKNASWRKAAEERIELLRKGELAVSVLDSSGRPAKGVQVHCRMTRHAFGFGTAISAGTLMGQGPDYDRYRKTIETYFNKVTFENELKWPQWEDPGNRQQLQKALEWLKQRNIAVRGHVLVWPSWNNVPRRLSRYKFRPEKLEDEIDAHIREEVGTLSGWVDEWDVVNEFYQHRDLTRVLGRSAIADWFKTAHAADPSARLFYNDYVMFKGTARGEAGRHAMDTLRFLKREGAPVSGIGEQGHLGDNAPTPAEVVRALDEFAKTGLKIQITEFDIDSADSQFQAAYMRDFLTAVFSHPAVEGFVLWGFWEARQWKPRAALWRKDWSLRPHGEMFVDLVTNRWWTDETLVTDGQGRARVRGFCGDYSIEVAGAETLRVSLTRAGATAAIQLNP